MSSESRSNVLEPFTLINTSDSAKGLRVYSEPLIGTCNEPVLKLKIMNSKTFGIQNSYMNEANKLKIKKLINETDSSLRPNKVSVKNANKILDILASQNLNPKFINLSEDKSILLELFDDVNYYLFETFDDDDIVFLKRNKITEEREVYDLTSQSIKETINSIFKK